MGLRVVAVGVSAQPCEPRWRSRLP